MLVANGLSNFPAYLRPEYWKKSILQFFNSAKCLVLDFKE